jgi:hypothetical protein
VRQYSSKFKVKEQKKKVFSPFELFEKQAPAITVQLSLTKARCLHLAEVRNQTMRSSDTATA